MRLVTAFSQLCVPCLKAGFVFLGNGTHMQAHVAFRVLWFTTVKACINTVMVMTGWKKSGVFKATPKLGETAEDAQVSARLPDVTSSDGGRGSDTPAKEKFHLHHIHDKLSKVSPSHTSLLCWECSPCRAAAIERSEQCSHWACFMFDIDGCADSSRPEAVWCRLQR